MACVEVYIAHGAGFSDSLNLSLSDKVQVPP